MNIGLFVPMTMVRNVISVSKVSWIALCYDQSGSQGGSAKLLPVLKDDFEEFLKDKTKMKKEKISCSIDYC